MSAFADLLKPVNAAEARQADIRPDYLQGRAPIAIAAPSAPREVPPQSLPPIPFIAGLPPESTQFFDDCWPTALVAIFTPRGGAPERST
jgi:hypothetical protein